MPDLPWYVYAMLLAPLALILFAAIFQTLKVRIARDWAQAPGRVVVSESQLRDVRILDDSRETDFRFEKRNFANIVYEYAVRGQTLQNNRVSLGEDRGNFGVAETIARYPVGTAVSVYYNPRHPNEAVLERDLPKGLWGCLGIGTVIVLAILFGSIIGLNQLTAFVASRLGDPKLSPLVVVLMAFGFFLSLFAIAMWRQSSLARRWPVVPGVIKMSDVEQYRAAPESRYRRGPMMYQRQVSFSYRFNDVAYSAIHGSLATGVNSTSGWLMRRFMAAYRDGDNVKVYVNPVNPSEATLNPRAGLVWISGILWLSSAAFWAAAYYTARL